MKLDIACPAWAASFKMTRLSSDECLKSSSKAIEVLFLTLSAYDKLKVEVAGWFVEEGPFVLLHLLDLNQQGKMEKALKEFGAWPMARLANCDIPEVEYQMVFGRSIRRKIMSVVPSDGKLMKNDPTSRRVRSHVSMCQAFLQLKRCYDPVGKDFVRSNLLKHQQGVGVAFDRDVLLTYESVRSTYRVHRPRIKSLRNDSPYLGSVLIEAVERLACYLIPKGTRRDLRDELITPSLHASFDTPCHKGGAAGEILRSLKTRCESYSPCQLPFDRTIYTSFDEKGHLFTPTIRLPRDIVSGFTSEQRAELETSQDPILNGFLNQYLESAAMKAIDEFPVKARVVPVLEPCKVRCVSCGEAGDYIGAFKWDRLIRSFTCRKSKFQTMRSKIKPVDLLKVLNQGYDFWVKQRHADIDDLCIVSGDYSAATDGIDPVFSRTLLRRLALQVALPKEQTAILENCLLNHQMVYEKDSEKRKWMGPDDPISLKQLRGQLMGSPISFPILCFVNFLINWVFIDPELRCPIDRVPILVNGDDLFMVIPLSYYKGVNSWTAPEHPFGVSWREFISIVGFTESLGKNYIHSTMFCINSQFYLWDRVVTERISGWELIKNFSSVPRYVDYCRLSLLTGGGRLVKTDVGGGKFDLSMSDRISRFADSSYEFGSAWTKDPQSVAAVWIDFNSDLYKRYLTKTPLAFRLPVCLGGCGLIHDYGGLSERDRKWGGYLLRNRVNIPKMHSSAIATWVTTTQDERTKQLALSEGYVERFANAWERLAGSDFQGPDVLGALLLEDLQIGIKKPTSITQEVDGKPEFARGESVGDWEFDRYLQKLKKAYRRFLAAEHSVQPISHQVYEAVWDYPLSFDYFEQM
jgi:hypothetical protein